MQPSQTAAGEKQGYFFLLCHGQETSVLQAPYIPHSWPPTLFSEPSLLVYGSHPHCSSWWECLPVVEWLEFADRLCALEHLEELSVSREWDQDQCHEQRVSQGTSFSSHTGRWPDLTSELEGYKWRWTEQDTHYYMLVSKKMQTC